MLLQILGVFLDALDLLDDYDHQRIRLGQIRKGEFKGVSYSEAMQIIDQLRTAYGASPLFGKEKDARAVYLDRIAELLANAGCFRKPGWTLLHPEHVEPLIQGAERK
ncbi:MAG: hypothetical protein WAL98_19525 [Desulfatiglandaceae bacterium]